jgi:hypothetical protein
MRLYGLTALAIGLLVAPNLEAIADRPDKNRGNLKVRDLRQLQGKWMAVLLKSEGGRVAGEAVNDLRIRTTI